MEKKIPRMLLALLILLAAVYAANIAVTVGMVSSINKDVARLEEEARPARIDVITIIDSSCRQCFDIDSVLSALAGSEKLTIGKERTVEFSSADGRSFIEKTKITKIPAIIVTGEADKPSLDSFWGSAWEKASLDGKSAMVFGNPLPPYKDLATDEIKGLVKLVFLNDSSCSACYDVLLHKMILQRFGLSIAEETTYDAGSDEGKELMSKYNITKIPTFVLTKDAAVYSGLNLVWSQVGTIEEDGSYVFRSTEVMGAYKNMTTGEIVSVETS